MRGRRRPTCDRFPRFGTPKHLGTESAKTIPARGAPKPAPIPGVARVDPAAAETITVDLEKPRQLCAPADDGGGRSDAVTQLEASQAKLAKGLPKLVKRAHVRVASPRGTLRLDTQKLLLLLVPTAKDLAVDPAPRELAEIAVDHYRCDKVKLTKGAPKFPKGLRIVAAMSGSRPGVAAALRQTPAASSSFVGSTRSGR